MILQSLKMAAKSIASNKLRSLLTMLGIIIGVVSLVVLVSLVNGATTEVTDQISSLGSSSLTVSITDDKGNPLRLEDIQGFMDEESIALTAPESRLTLTGRYGSNNDRVQVTATTAAAMDIEGLELSAGRFIKTTDVDQANYVVVINSTMAEELVGRKSCVGETVALNGIHFTVVGILDDDSESLTSSFGGDDMAAYIPFTTGIRVTSRMSSEISSFRVASNTEADLAEAEEVLTDILMKRFKQDEDAFTIINSSEIMEALSSVTDTLSLLLGGIAAISLLVGGIGIMNIMLVSVTERTREIGIRKAIGAGKGTILLQFLIEALAISLMGCGIGVALSKLILIVVNVVGDVSYGLNGTVVLVSILFSVVIGMVFGIYPAWKAASKTPIDALRYEG